MKPIVAIRLVLAIFITVLWSTSYIVSVTQKNFTGFEVATPIMGLAISVLVGVEIVKRKNGSDK